MVMETEVIKEAVEVMIEVILVLEEMEIEVSREVVTVKEDSKEVVSMKEVFKEEVTVIEASMEVMVIEAILGTMTEASPVTVIEVFLVIMTEDIQVQVRAMICPTEAVVCWVPRPH